METWDFLTELLKTVKDKHEIDGMKVVQIANQDGTILWEDDGKD